MRSRSLDAIILDHSVIILHHPGSLPLIARERDDLAAVFRLITSRLSEGDHAQCKVCEAILLEAEGLLRHNVICVLYVTAETLTIRTSFCTSISQHCYLSIVTIVNDNFFTH